MVAMEAGRVAAIARLWKFRDPDGSVARGLERGESVERFRERVIEYREVKGNLFLSEGVNFIWLAVTGAAGLTPFNQYNSYIGVGDGSTPPSPGQAGLQGSNRYYKRVDLDYPRVSETSITFRATFGPGEAEFAWNEWTVANGPSDEAVNLNRKVEAMGVKGPNSTWTLEVTLSIS